MIRDLRSAGRPVEEIRMLIRRMIEAPASMVDDPDVGKLASALSQPLVRQHVARREPVAWRQWGEDLDPASVEQMRNACALPVAVRGALMPDAHVGYGLPIGGVLATENAVIPYAVGVDIACRMRLSVLDLPLTALSGQQERLINAIERETRFGVGASFGPRREHAVMDADWSVTEVTRRLKDKAWSQLGTSGSGNHFVEFGVLRVAQPVMEQGFALEPGEYLALLSHSGSRGPGAAVAGHYSRLAMEQRADLPKQLKHLAWLDMDSEAGQAYWASMELMGEFAAANHAVIHREIARHLGVGVMAQVENHHNFAWKETHNIDGGMREVIVHRKGATPAGAGVLGIIPGSMASPGFVVRGRGEAASLHSASHGAGRVMSRTQAKATITRSAMKRHLAERGIRLLSAGIDEAPFVYKDIHAVMRAQTSLVEVLAQFDPKIVKMAPDGERPED